MEREAEKIIREKILQAGQRPVAWDKAGVWRALQATAQHPARRWWPMAAAAVLTMFLIVAIDRGERQVPPVAAVIKQRDAVQTRDAAPGAPMPTPHADKQTVQNPLKEPAATGAHRSHTGARSFDETTEIVAATAAPTIDSLNDAATTDSHTNTTAVSATLATHETPKVRAVVGVWIEAPDAPAPPPRRQRLRLTRNKLDTPDDDFAVETKKVMARLH